jgi:hypothetical protein
MHANLTGFGVGGRSLFLNISESVGRILGALMNRTLRDAKARRVVERLEREVAGLEAPGGSGGE